MMTRRLFAICGFLTVAAVALTSCSSSTPKPETLPVAELRQEWFPNANFAGEVSASKRFAKDEKIQLKVVPGAEDVDPIKVVLSKGADFGVVGGDLLHAVTLHVEHAPVADRGPLREEQADPLGRGERLLHLGNPPGGRALQLRGGDGLAVLHGGSRAARAAATLSPGFKTTSHENRPGSLRSSRSEIGRVMLRLSAY